MNSIQVRRYLEARRKIVDRELRRLVAAGKPATVYGPLRHALAPGGKRLRAILVMLSSSAVGGDESIALPAAVALECLHNFTLIHDDVMDRSPLRRGKPTVHARWNEAVAILAGDHLLSLGYGRLIESAAGRTSGRVLRAYTRAFRDVCEGQGFDLEFESRRSVTMREYRSMIGLKTARLIAAAAEIGALAGGGSPAQVKALRTYGERLGMAFQIRDDVLDVTGSAKEFGKVIGSDIARGKKTYLFVKALERARGRDAAILRSIHRPDAPGGPGRNGKAAVERARAVYHRTGAVDDARRDIRTLTRSAASALRGLPATEGRDVLLAFADRLADRTV